MKKLMASNLARPGTAAATSLQTLVHTVDNKKRKTKRREENEQHRHCAAPFVSPSHFPSLPPSRPQYWIEHYSCTLAMNS